MDNTYGELKCPLCHLPNMALVGQFHSDRQGEAVAPHLRCQRCWGDSIWVEMYGEDDEMKLEAFAWRSKEERLDRDNQSIL